MSVDFDLVVLGGGTGGLVSSLVVGARVALVERDRTGGDCLWTGCVPSKTLISTARLAHRMRHADAVGLVAVEPGVDFPRVMRRVHAAIRTIEPHDSPERLRGEGVTVIHGDGRFLDTRTLQVAGRRLTFRSAIVATGSEPRPAPLPGVEGPDVLTTDSFWEMTERPRRLVVVGGGPIGCELGQAMRRLGSEVVLVKYADRLLTKEEPAGGAELIAERLRAEGVEVRLATRAVEVHRSERDRPRLVAERPEGGRDSIELDKLLDATGRAPRTSGIGLERAGVATDAHGAVTVDDTLRTSAGNVFAVGDVTAAFLSLTWRRITRASRRSTRSSAPGTRSTRRSRG